MRRRTMLAAPLLATPLLAATAGAQPAGVAFEEFLIPGGDPGIQLYLRNKRGESTPAGRGDRVVLCLHGATYPASTSFDLPVGGVSWMDYMAGRGFDVWCLDLRNYGRSTREAAMGQPAEANAPLTSGEVAQKDIAAAAAFIRQRRDVPKIVHLGWSWGTSLQARFAADNPALVERLVLYAPQWLRDGPSPAAAGAGETLGAYRSVTRADARARWFNGVPEAKRASLFPAGWYEHWADATFATDPEGMRQVPSALRAPNGVLADSRAYWQSGKPFYDPAAITAPTLLVLAEWDRDTPPALAMALFPLLTRSPGKRLVVLAEGTHGILLERNRGALFQAVQVFLEEAIAG
ncbi:alpha/beta hydrolase [Roseomonas sp. USHLN139]|uniref:alpha/beta hydrolase n=1 Tax=Roseomonas sp. USHLN139 TaxID=3081298 RepID=UPI003B01D862